ncbi:uncharacterized protein Z518_04515 [Rhinocladiella mackenziei CBS 650.93]|uniref:Rhinocladiella mackenziei CBS 650.93 unplaced genomic scaffold supercont1.3, whole genome shotgun sequence n=1 Tax=Rhinocladiella mackenziei CBS 650.93 TaxID=1442369 RepID=A0A0D2ILF5_9EURO|nr:uncharacterized protein Z518_04515 [Rhinocladiella mackenziei CBS 650.93]KIX06539.1 hypothetical protein Z518_04515 [Rhinocladiella mackenziei CBS 650.93]
MKHGLISALLGSAFVGFALADLGKWMGGGDCPWGGKTASGSHPQRDIPDTGVTRYYDFTVARATMAPDGVSVPMIVVNGQFPGPMIEANWGDWIEVNVHNEIYGPEDMTMIHWHGLNQPGTPYYDGVATVDQCPIVPGSSLTYRFRADEYGTSWYHSHYSAQYSSGVMGPIVIHGPNDVEYDIDLGPIVVTDWFHDTYDHIVDLVLAPTDTNLPYRPFSDSNLVGGVGQYPCSNITDGTPCTTVPYAKWEFQPGKKHLLRFINTGATAFETISIDGHTMTVIANDFVPVQPYDTEFVTLGVSQRVDVVVTANAAPGNYWLRAWNSPQCGDSNAPDGRGIIYYSGGDPAAAPTSSGNPAPENRFCQNDNLATTVPQYAIPVANPDTTITLTVTGAPDATGVFHWLFNGVTYVGNLEMPLLLAAVQAQTAFPPENNVYNTGTNGTVRVVIINNLPAPHPMHLHGHDFQVLAEGSGTWDGSIVNPSNPQRRDVHMLWAGVGGANAAPPNYIVIQFEQDNPGIWPLHCHMAWHLSAGMSIMILERPEELAQIKVPDAVSATCDIFKQWQSAHPTTELDGLKKRNMAERMVEFMKGGKGGHVSHVDKHRKRGVRGWDHHHIDYEPWTGEKGTGTVERNMIPESLRKRDEV